MDQQLNQMVEFLVFNRGMVCLVWFALAGLRIMHLACSLAKLASLIRTMLGLLDLRRLRLARFVRADYTWFAWFA